MEARELETGNPEIQRPGDGFHLESTAAGRGKEVKGGHCTVRRLQTKLRSTRSKDHLSPREPAGPTILTTDPLLPLQLLRHFTDAANQSSSRDCS